MAELISGNIFIRENLLQEKGDALPGHEHTFDHTLYIPRGSADVLKFDKPNGSVVESVTLTAGQGRNWAKIEAGVFHTYVAREASTLGHCVYSHRTPQALVELQGKVSHEYDELLARLVALANERFAGLVQFYDGWQKALT